MKLVAKYSAYKTPNAYFKSSMRAATLLFFLILLANVQFNALANLSVSIGKVNYEIYSADWFHQFHHDAELPLESDSKPTESNTPEVKEPTDGEGDDWSKIAKGFILVHKASVSYSQNRIRSLQRDLQNRSTVSRIILHRCWKNFLV